MREMSCCLKRAALCLSLCLFVLLQPGCGSASPNRQVKSNAMSANTSMKSQTTSSAERKQERLASDIAFLRRQSYTADYHVDVVAGGTVFHVFHSVCTGSADGHCQAVDVFRDSKRHPVWHKQYIGVQRIRPSPKGFIVIADSYAPQDPLCCPSRPRVKDVYGWNGSRFVESGPLPDGP